MIRQKRKYLYFCAGPVPSQQEKAEAEKLGINAFRNASVIEPGSYLEPAEFVAGLAPERYQIMKGTVVIPREHDSNASDSSGSIPVDDGVDSVDRDGKEPPSSHSAQSDRKKTKGGK